MKNLIGKITHDRKMIRRTPMTYKVLDNKRVWLDKESHEFVVAKAESFEPYLAKEVDGDLPPFVDLGLTVFDGCHTVTISFDHERGNNKSIKAAQRKLDLVFDCLHVLEAHLQDASNNVEEEAAIKKAAKDAKKAAEKDVEYF
jgi:hypothetical protein